MRSKLFFQSIAVILILIGALHANLSAGARPPLANQSLPLSTGELENHDLHLPIIFNRNPLAPPIFGIESIQLTTTRLNRLEQANAYWVRYHTISWDLIEPSRTTPAEYHWETVNEAGLAEAAARNLNIIALIKFTPSWAQKIPPYACGPIDSADFAAFAEFLHALVTRYSGPPYNVKYWEIGNEPDVAPSQVGTNYRNIYGCWGDMNDPYFGGGYYAQMLQWAYPAIKSADPSAQVLIGGLLLACDPTYPPPSPDQDCSPARFFEGILRNGGANSFDIVSFHAYAYYAPGRPAGPIIDETNLGWNERGGVILGKIDFLREVMTTREVNKPLMLTETALTCPEWDSACTPASTPFFEAQADYVVSLYARTRAANVTGTVWYALDDDWRYVGLYPGTTPRPAYYTFQFMSQELAGTLTGGAVTSFAGVTGYEFFGQGKRIWVLWAPDRQDHAIVLPNGTIQVLDKYGNIITPVGGQVTVNSPTYIELSP